MKMSKKMIIMLSVLFSAVFCSNAFSKPEKNTVIINNSAKSSSSAGQQVISAPALVPSDAAKLRNFREKQEIKTEDSILKELEKQRLLDEQKRVDKILGQSKEASAPVSSAPVSLKSPWDDWFFGRKSFVSLGAGVVNYYEVTNINSTEQPAIFISFGAYGYKGFLIFELSAYYSKHYINTPNRNYEEFREIVDQPALSMAVKLTPLNGRVKPYVGISGSMVARRWGVVRRDGTDLNEIIDPKFENLKRDVAKKEWYLSFDAGAAVGADIALGDSLGLNVDLRYHLNLHTENRKTAYQYLEHTEILDERDSIIASVNFRYYFH
ncbi:MAG: hypothetical protein OXN83_02160 [Oligoflexia bacterium]|nr:hypothetical protein [Oligoflexia bacterium]